MSSTTRTRTSRGRRPTAPAPATAPVTGRPLSVAAVVAALSSVATGLVLCMAVALIGWFLSDAGAHGATTDALRAGADAWLLGLGSTLQAGGVPIGLTPLGLSAVLLLVAFRTGRWAGRDAADDGTLGLAVGVTALLHLVLAVVVAVLATQGGGAASVPQAMLGGLLLGAIGSGLGLAAGSGRLVDRWALVPGPVRTVLTGTTTTAAAVLACAALLVALSLLLSFNDAATSLSGLDLSLGDGLMVLVVSVLLAPNAVLFGVSWLTGPGFALGTGTSVTATAVTLGPLPAFPLLAALPSPGSQPGWFAVLLAVPPLCAALGAGLAQARYAVTAWDSAGLRAFAVGFGSAIALTVLAGLAGGPLGTGRMADIGVPVGSLLVSIVGGMSIGGLLGGLAVTAWQRRR